MRDSGNVEAKNRCAKGGFKLGFFSPSRCPFFVGLIWDNKKRIISLLGGMKNGCVVFFLQRSKLPTDTHDSIPIQCEVTFKTGPGIYKASAHLFV